MSTLERRGEERRREERIQTPPNPPRGVAKPAQAKSKPKKSKPHDPAATEIPPELGEAFRPTWTEWCGYRADIRKKLSKRTATAQLAKLAKLGTAEAKATIERSIEAGWTGLFPDDGQSGNGRPGRKRRGKTIREMAKEAGVDLGE